MIEEFHNTTCDERQLNLEVRIIVSFQRFLPTATTQVDGNLFRFEVSHRFSKEKSKIINNLTLWISFYLGEISIECQIKTVTFCS